MISVEIPDFRMSLIEKPSFKTDGKIPESSKFLNALFFIDYINNLYKY